MFSFFVFLKKQKTVDYKKASWPKFCNIIIFFFAENRSVGPVDQQINLVSPYIKNSGRCIQEIITYKGFCVIENTFCFNGRLQLIYLQNLEFILLGLIQGSNTSFLR